MYLSITSWSFPHCTLAEAAGIAKALGIEAVDVGLLHKPALGRDAILSDPDGSADEMAALGLQVANYYHLFGDGLEPRNLALPGTVDDNAEDLARVMRFADRAKIPTVFVLPGIVNPGQSRRDAFEASVDSLKALGNVAKDFRAALTFEPHVHSFAEAPDLVRELAERTGVPLTLDYAHFICLGYRQDEIDPLAPYAAHVHLRQARMGALQTKFAEGTLNFPALFGTLRQAGYAGALSIEPVHQDYMNTLYEDVLTEAIALRDIWRTWSEVP